MFEYTTQVRIDRQELSKVVEELKENYMQIGNRETHEGRSRFSAYNNIAKFQERIQTGEIFNESDTFTVKGEAKGKSARVYFKPSVTSLAKPIRRAIIPTNPNNIFVFFDLKAAEFAMNAIFAQEVEAVNSYHQGGDIYMHYASIFPEGTERAIIKKILIANMYNKSAYSTAIDLGCTETVAQRYLDQVAASLPRMTMLKRRICSYDLQHNGYFAPDGFDQTKLIKVASIDPAKGFNPDFALSAYTQSALGFFMQKFTTNLVSRVKGTLLSVFDSVLVEIKPESFDRYCEFVRNHVSPLLPGEITCGRTFYEAAYGGIERPEQLS